jgi:hypothetical protein
MVPDKQRRSMVLSMNHPAPDALAEAMIGFAGGVAAELVQWFGLRFSLHQKLPDWSKSWLYWIVTLLMAVSGGGLVYLYALSGTALSPILALNVGASAPLLLGKLVQQTPPIGSGRIS